MQNHVKKIVENKYKSMNKVSETENSDKHGDDDTDIQIIENDDEDSNDSQSKN